MSTTMVPDNVTKEQPTEGLQLDGELERFRVLGYWLSLAESPEQGPKEKAPPPRCACITPARWTCRCGRRRRSCRW